MTFTLKDLVKFIEDSEERFPESKAILEVIKYRVNILQGLMREAESSTGDLLDTRWFIKTVVLGE